MVSFCSAPVALGAHLVGPAVSWGDAAGPPGCLRTVVSAGRGSGRSVGAADRRFQSISGGDQFSQSSQLNLAVLAREAEIPRKRAEGFFSI